jgi:hypothetical protein
MSPSEDSGEGSQTLGHPQTQGCDKVKSRQSEEQRGRSASQSPIPADRSGPWRRPGKDDTLGEVWGPKS